MYCHRETTQFPAVINAANYCMDDVDEIIVGSSSSSAVGAAVDGQRKVSPSFHASARRPSRQFCLNLEALDGAAAAGGSAPLTRAPPSVSLVEAYDIFGNASALRRISSTPFPWERRETAARQRCASISVRRHENAGERRNSDESTFRFNFAMDSRLDEALEDDYVDFVPPPSHAPPHPPAMLALPVVPQRPAAYSFSVEPPRAVFTLDGGVSRHMLLNQSADRFAIKVRCSNNFFFRVNPVYSFLDPGSAAEIELIRLQGGKRARDRLQIIYTICRAGDSDASTLFGNEAKTRIITLAICTL